MTVAATTDVTGPGLDALRRALQDLGRVVVAFSGGADSAFLARVAHDTLGVDRVHVVTAVSPSLAGDERADAAALADEWGLRWSAVETHEMADAAYRVNDGDRCGRCKVALMDVLTPIAADELATVVLGALLAMAMIGASYLVRDERLANLIWDMEGDQ